MGGTNGEKLLPCVFVLQMKTSYSTYNEVFNQLKVTGEKYGFSLQPRLVLADFEKSSRKAYKFNFPGVRLRGCYFHYKQAIGRWIYQHSYKPAYIHNLGFKK